MSKPELGKVAVGDDLLVIEKQHTGFDKEPIAVAVTKVGRIWIEMTEIYQVRSMARTWRMRSDTQSESDSASRYAARFVTSEQRAWEVRVEAADAYLTQEKVMPDYASKWYRDPGRRLVLANLLRHHEGLPEL